MIRLQYIDQEGHRHMDVSVDDIPAILNAQQGILWLDLVETSPEVARPILEDTFGFHPLAVEDALEETHIPKVDDWGDYLYLVFYAMTANATEVSQLDLLELDCFLTPHCLVTYQVHRTAVVDSCWDNLLVDPRLANHGAPRLLYQLLDLLTTSYMLTLDALDEHAELVEDRIFDQPTEALLGEIFAFKRALLKLRRTLGPQREVMNKLSRGDFSTIDRTDAVYFRDIYDHLVRLNDITDSMRDIVNGTLDMYLSVVNNRMNEVMKTLTLITTLFMPLSFLVGFFGMNFFQPVVNRPGWTGTGALGLTIGAMLVLPLVMYGWMRRRGLY